MRRVNVIVDNDSWIIPYAKKLVNELNVAGNKAVFEKDYGKVQEADVSFYLGCMKITPPEVLAKSAKNLVVHESDLPHGRGFSPLTWQVLEGRDVIPVALLEMAEEVDAGDVVDKLDIELQGHELVDELRELQGNATIALALRYMGHKELPKGKPQTGEPSWYERRRPVDSKLDISKNIDEQFNLLRVVDNEKYPAFFEKDGYKYIIKIQKEKL